MCKTSRERARRGLLKSASFVYSHILIPILVVSAVLIAADDGLAATNMTPIAVAGFNRDVVVENTAVGPPYTSYAQEFNYGEGTAFYQAGLTSNGVPYAFGFPASGQFTNPASGGATNGTLTLTTPTTYSRIAVVAHSGNGTSSGTAQLAVRFNDGSVFITNYLAPDWFGNTFNVALQGVNRVNLTSGAANGGSAGNPRFYQTTINLYTLGASNKPVSSLSFGMPPSSRSTGVYAVSGFASSSVTHAGVTNLPATGINAVSAVLNGQVTGTGGESPLVTLYYGPSNGGTTAANWANSVNLGFQTGAFSQIVSVSPNTTYFFTASATNAAGLVWAAPSQTFTTPPLTIPVITNQPASNVQATLATLPGTVVNGGGEVPTVTLYYGTNDGGTSAAGWSNSISLGGQSGGFAQTVGALAANTTYYFTASAGNDAGVGWATPSLSFTTGAANAPWPFTAVLTQHNDNNRSGQNLNETALNVSNVKTNRFGLLYSRPVDDQVYAQPLIATNVTVLGQGSRNLLIVATVNDTVFAYDADDPTVVAPYWTNSFIAPPNIVPPKNSDESAIGACGHNYQDFSGQFGIVGTPVIDPVSGTIYLVARTKETSGGITTFVQRLHALDVRTGLDRSNSPVVIAATYLGSGAGSSGGTNTFDPLRNNQRPALVLANGIVYISWSSHCDNGPYHGWLIGYNAQTLQQAAVYNDTPNGSEGGIWMSGQGPAADTNGNIFLMVGNGTVDTTTNSDYGESFLKLTNNNGTLSVASYFIPYNWSALNSGDLDMGTVGMLLIPGTSLAISGGKAGWLYLVNRDNMGGLSSSGSDNNILQSWMLGGGEIHGGPTFWSTTNGSFMYVWADTGDYLRQYQFTNGLFLTNAPYAHGVATGGSGSPGGILSISANGTNAGTGIIWASVNTSSDANQAVVAGTLHAFNAVNVSQELWNSDMLPRDSIGNLAKFVPPTVANGKVYMATFSDQINVYGLYPPPPLGIISAANGNTIITWPTNTPPGFTLQATTNLTSASWNTVTNSVVKSNGVYQVTVPSTTPMNFYRLKM